MAKIHARGRTTLAEVHRYYSNGKIARYRLMSDGVILSRFCNSKWKIHDKTAITVEQWLDLMTSVGYVKV